MMTRVVIGHWHSACAPFRVVGWHSNYCSMNIVPYSSSLSYLSQSTISIDAPHTHTKGELSYLTTRSLHFCPGLLPLSLKVLPLFPSPPFAFLVFPFHPPISQDCCFLMLMKPRLPTVACDSRGVVGEVTVALIVNGAQTRCRA